MEERQVAPAVLAESSGPDETRDSPAEEEPSWTTWPLKADGTPVYPLEPLLDRDYIYNDQAGSSNYLEDYDNTSQMVDQMLIDFGYERSISGAPAPTAMASTTTTTAAPTATEA